MPRAQEVDENQTILTFKMDGMQSKIDGVQSKIDEMQSALCDMVENAQEVYVPAVNAPAPSHTVRLDFGNASTPEGLLKKSVLRSESSEIVSAATGVIKPAYGVLGMGREWENVVALQGPRIR